MRYNYEDSTYTRLPRRTNVVIRLTCDSDSSPNVRDFHNSMVKVAEDVCCNIYCAKLAFVCYKDIFIILHDYERVSSTMWFDGDVQKIASRSASLATNSSGLIFSSKVFPICSSFELTSYLGMKQLNIEKGLLRHLAIPFSSYNELMYSNLAALHHILDTNNINPYNIDAELRKGTILKLNKDGMWESNVMDIIKNRELLLEYLGARKE